MRQPCETKRIALVVAKTKLSVSVILNFRKKPGQKLFSLISRVVPF